MTKGETERKRSFSWFTAQMTVMAKVCQAKTRSLEFHHISHMGTWAIFSGFARYINRYLVQKLGSQLELACLYGMPESQMAGSVNHCVSAPQNASQ